MAGIDRGAALTHGRGSIGVSHSGILDESGTYFFTKYVRCGLRSNAIAGFAILLLYNERTKEDSIPNGVRGMMSLWQTGVYPDPELFFRTETQKALYSTDGSSVWADVLPWKYNAYGYRAFGIVPLNGRTTGEFAALSRSHPVHTANFQPTMGMDGRSFLLRRNRVDQCRSNRDPGQFPEVLGEEDLAIGRLGASKVKRFAIPTKLKSPDLYEWHLNAYLPSPLSRACGRHSNDEGETPKPPRPLAASIWRRQVHCGNTRVPDNRISIASAEQGQLAVSRGWIFPSGRKVLVQLSNGWDPGMKDTTWRTPHAL